MSALLGFLILGWTSLVGSVPVHEENSKSLSTGFVGRGTNELATALLQGFAEKEENMVYSPFGYSAILAVFSEGARGASRQEIADALHFPSDVEVVRQAYRSVLERFSANKFSNNPEFKNWFYVYKNYTVEEELQNVLRKYYLTEVKTVDRPEEYVKDRPKKPVQVQSAAPQKAGIETEMEMPAEPAAPMQEAVKSEMTVTEESKPATEAAKAEQPAAAMEVVKSEQTEQPAPAMEEVKGEQVEQPRPVMTEGAKSEKTEAVAEETKSQNVEQPRPVMEAVKNENAEHPAPMMEKVKSEIKEEAKPNEAEPMQEAASGEKMMAPIKTQAEFGVLPVDHFSGRTDSSVRIKGKEQSTRMVIFNGLYYKGEWETPFVKRPADDSRVFYKSETEKVTTSTIHSQGVFNYGNVLDLDCRAIDLPYKGGRYSLLVLVPNSRNGLAKLISNLSGYSLSSVYDQLSEKLVDVCLPSFEINTISKPVTPVNKVGLSKVTSIFSPETADLSGISAEDAGLYVEELVQMVTFRVDANYSKTNFLTASTASSRSNVHKFQINQPFLFYLRDNLEDIVIVNGKVLDPTPRSYLYFS